jgi:D-alanine-D-alanine ligase-like ATP-grasp enzyme
MKNITGCKYADFYLNAANKLELSYKIISKKISFVKIFNDDKELCLQANCLDVNNQVSSRICENKYKTSTLLKSQRVPVPDFNLFEDKTDALKTAKNLVKEAKSIVIKPCSSSLGQGITINPKTNDEIIQAINEAFSINSSILIEEYIEGEDYRITIFQNDIIAISRRIPAYVIGDGIKNIEQLIANKNLKRVKSNLPIIVIKEKDIDFLKSKSLNINTIPTKNKYIKLKSGCNIDIGGETQKIETDSIPEVNIKLFKKITKVLKLDFAGIDFISQDIKKPHTQVVSAINEVNSAPQLDVHYFDSSPFNNYAAERILQKYFFSESVAQDKKVEIIGQIYNLKTLERQ